MFHQVYSQCNRTEIEDLHSRNEDYAINCLCRSVSVWFLREHRVHLRAMVATTGEDLRPGELVTLDQNGRVVRMQYNDQVLVGQVIRSTTNWVAEINIVR